MPAWGGVVIGETETAVGAVQITGGDLSAGVVRLGTQSGGQASLWIRGGSLWASGLVVGEGGRLRIDGFHDGETYFSDLILDENGDFSAEPGSAISVNRFCNRSSDPTAVSGMRNLWLDVCGTNVGVLAEVEASCLDVGADVAGLFDGFALRGLELGEEDVFRMIKLLDEFDNQLGSTGREAMYVYDLIIHPDTQVDLTDANLYYLNATIGENVTFVGGEPTWVPEPACVGFFAPGAAWLLLGRRRRR